MNTSILKISTLVLGTVLLNLAGMFLLKTMVLNQPLPWLIIGLGIGTVVTMHLVRFALWGLIHIRSELVFSYALTSVYYLTIIPAMHYFDEPVRWQHYAGSVLITIGVALVIVNKHKTPAETLPDTN